MTLRKTAGLLMAFGLVIGLVGTGIGASFVDQVTATENITVGTFGCEIDLDRRRDSPRGSSITYDAPEITSSAAGNAPFTFTVTNVGSIPQQLTITDERARRQVLGHAPDAGQSGSAGCQWSPGLRYRYRVD